MVKLIFVARVVRISRSAMSSCKCVVSVLSELIFFVVVYCMMMFFDVFLCVGVFLFVFNVEDVMFESIEV